MAYPVLIPFNSLPTFTSSTPTHYPPRRPGMKLTEKKRWSVKRLLLLVLSGIAGFDFCNEFALGSGKKGPPVVIPSDKGTGGGSLLRGWRERSLALLHRSAGRRQPPPPPSPRPVTPAQPSQTPSRSVTLVYANGAREEEEEKADDGVSHYEREESVQGGWLQPRGLLPAMVAQDSYIGLVERD